MVLVLINFLFLRPILYYNFDTMTIKNKILRNVILIGEHQSAVSPQQTHIQPIASPLPVQACTVVASRGQDYSCRGLVQVTTF